MLATVFQCSGFIVWTFSSSFRVLVLIHEQTREQKLEKESDRTFSKKVKHGGTKIFWSFSDGRCMKGLGSFLFFRRSHVWRFVFSSNFLRDRQSQMQGDPSSKLSEKEKCEQSGAKFQQMAHFSIRLSETEDSAVSRIHPGRLELETLHLKVSEGPFPNVLTAPSEQHVWT